MTFNIKCTQNKNIYPVFCKMFINYCTCLYFSIFYILGEIGDQRFCSARDLGNYCEYIRRNVDDREFRSCVYTCNTDGCNAANTVNAHTAAMAVVWFMISLEAFTYAARYIS